MLIIPNRIAKIIANGSFICALLYQSLAVASSAMAEGEATRTQIILNMIAEIKVADNVNMRKDKSRRLTDYIRRTIRSGHNSAINEAVLHGLEDLLNEPDDRFWVALAIAQIGRRASSLTPKLKAVLEEENRKEKERFRQEGILLYGPADTIDSICVALKKMPTDMPRTCLERD